ncbi:MAG: toprim domain-containing protein [Candidatus Doudnabacteria bacterium]
MSKLDEAKEVDIISYLSSIGYEPKKAGGNKVWYNSPLHIESTPSFYVSGSKWRDMGCISLEKPFGDVIDLCQEVNNCSRMEAIDTLINGTSIPKFEPREVTDESKLVILNVYEEIKDQRLKDYLKKRCITENVYNRYLGEAHYCFSSNPEKVYTACSFRNDKGGYELRSNWHKYVAVPKHYTTFGEGTTLNLYEGFINALSSLCYFGMEEFQQTTIVLNGLGILRRLLDELPKYTKINCFLDHGEKGGDVAMDLIRAKVGADRCYDHRYLYPIDMDFNDLLISLNK